MDPEPRTYKRAQQIFIRHIILNIPNPPPDWVYEILDRGS